MRQWFWTAAILIGLASPAWAQPTLGSQNYIAASTSAQAITLATVNSGAAIVVMVYQTASAVRTYTVSDDASNSYASQAAAAGCGATRCAQVFATYASPSADPLTITVTQSSSLQAYAIVAYEVNCSPSCAADTASSFANGSVTTHLTSADSTVIDTAANVFVGSGCAGSASFGTETPKATWTAFTESHSQVMAQYLSTASALTDERAELTSSSARTSECVVVSVKNASAATTKHYLMMTGVGGRQ